MNQLAIFFIMLFDLEYLKNSILTYKYIKKWYMYCRCTVYLHPEMQCIFFFKITFKACFIYFMLIINGVSISEETSIFIFQE